MNIGQNKRIHDFLNKNRTSIVADLSKGLLGTEYTNISEAINKAKKAKLDGIILSAGAVKSHLNDLIGKDVPALIIKADWSNYLLNEESQYPSQDFR
ncbi:MAG: hypothetical protein GF364_10385, partial [Candidatus Lokiarchaeota archaeon]|nr:hypothetical protein [Candidatus Lokiarchaeota archaeon]